MTSTTLSKRKPAPPRVLLRRRVEDLIIEMIYYTWRTLRFLLRLTLFLLVLLVVAAVCVTGWVLPGRWTAPPDTAFQRADPFAIQYDVPLDDVSRNMLVAVIAKEDQGFPERQYTAFDYVKFYDRAKTYVTKDGHDSDAGGSTIDQQLAKNIWLSPDRSAWRKGAEAVLASSMALTWSQQTRLEDYVNNVEFAPNIWGVCAASWYYYNVPPAMLDVQQSAELVGTLPSPRTMKRLPAGGMDYEPRRIVAWSKANTPQRMRDIGGLEAVHKIGLYGIAQDHAYGCASMPYEVKVKIESEGGTIPDPTH